MSASVSVPNIGSFAALYQQRPSVASDLIAARSRDYGNQLQLEGEKIRAQTENNRTEAQYRLGVMNPIATGYQGGIQEIGANYRNSLDNYGGLITSSGAAAAGSENRDYERERLDRTMDYYEKATRDLRNAQSKANRGEAISSLLGGGIGLLGNILGGPALNVASIGARMLNG